MGLLPAGIEEEYNEEIEQETALEEAVEYGIDFTTGKATGSVVRGLQAVKVWVYLALHTPIYEYTIFTWEYGNELKAIVQQGYRRELFESEAERAIRECLGVSPYIHDVAGFVFEYIKSTVVIRFTVECLYGDFEERYEIESIA